VILPHETKLPVAGTSILTAVTHICVLFSISKPSICSRGTRSAGREAHADSKSAHRHVSVIRIIVSLQDAKPVNNSHTADLLILITRVIFQSQIRFHILIQIDQQLFVDFEKAHDRPVKIGNQYNHSRKGNRERYGCNRAASVG